ncbi:VOC family protein [Fertoebacter nigrum]|uniref:VOC family protein n=1 Tax=Fertoeibacter niger TaxID=2656921 RepID=A0A8X8H3S7_9RHOB|nr:VOC family protein [Fertoeibacter niger]NUB45824.1 VOC family protein [Fertoeibacter niger]
MTANRGHVTASQINGPGVHSLDSFSFHVPDIAQAEAFHRAFGLVTRERGNALELLTDGAPHVWCRVTEWSRKSLSYLSFGIFEEDLDRFKRHLSECHIALVDAPPGLETNGLWFRDFEGTLVELKVAGKSSPDQKSHGMLISSDPGVAGSPKRSQAGLVRPARMSHILLFTSDVDRAVAFYTRVLGLGLSDRAGSNIAFLHGRHGSDHHMVAFVRSTAPGIHHTSWDVPSIHEVGLGAMVMADRGFTDGWGVGRHVLGSNYFHYVRDPWGSYAEYSCDMDYIPKDAGWTAEDHDDDDAFYVWGPKPPADFGVNHEA